jgi:hypothetical protein
MSRRKWRRLFEPRKRARRNSKPCDKDDESQARRIRQDNARACDALLNLLRRHHADDHKQVHRRVA